jgi:hypothetical protein
MKYIISKDPLNPGPFIFPKLMGHDEMLTLLRLSRRDISSAGFVTMKSGKVSCYGVSESLGVKSKPEEDNALIAELLGGS